MNPTPPPHSPDTAHGVGASPPELNAPSSFAEREDWLRGQEGRRRKGALVLFALWAGVMLLHWLPIGRALVWGLTAIATLHALRLVFARPSSTQPLPAPEPEAWPKVSVLVSAKDEEGVVGRLVEMLCRLDYPADRLEVWFVDDGSSDRTPQVLAALTERFEALRVLRRPPGAGGGKSGALNAVIPKTSGEILAVFDADAQVPADLLRRVVPSFGPARVGAVQLRKAIVQAEQSQHPQRQNFWIRGQQAEMALDSFFQAQRIAIGGIGELRGNGQFIRRSALERCGGFNEETITDDLDLTLRLHLDGWDIGAIATPPVLEEGVTRLAALWPQRNRWAEGGYQRYLDYWRPMAQGRLGAAKTTDLLVFCVLQYLLPQAILPDVLIALVRQEWPVLSPLVMAVTGWLPAIGMFLGLRRAAVSGQALPINFPQRLGGWAQAAAQTALGSVYMLHWLPTIAAMGLRVALRPKQLKWVKTVHAGAGELAIDLDDGSVG